MADALYVADGGTMVPSPLTGGPWSADAQHGGPVAALLARTVERAPTDAAMQVVRLTVELVRPVPLRPLVAAATVSRPGRRVQLVDARLTADGEDVAWARALRVRTASLELPEIAADGAAHQPPPDGSPRPDLGPARVPYLEAVDLRFVEGDWGVPGPVRMWSRLVVPVVAGEEATPLQRTAAAADFGNGVSAVLDFQRWVFINPDLTVSLSRVPVGEWIGFDAVSRVSPEGYGLAESSIFDASGTVGRATQSLFVDGR